jgi:hypothetical protein
MRTHRTISTVLLALSLAGCAPMQPLSCGIGEQLFIHDLLYFGTAKSNGIVTSEQWSEFLRTTVTPRFPQGLTVWQASGQWQASDGAIVREASHVLSLAHPADVAGEKAVIEIVAAYKTQFQQESVLRVKAAACATF